MKKTSLAGLLSSKGILKNGDFKLRSGLRSSFYCDIKEALGDADVLTEIVKGLIPLIPKQATCIAGSGYGGIALASIAAFQKKLPLVLVRDRVKDHGTKKMLEGYVPTKKDLVCIIDDVFTTGSSMRDLKKNLAVTKCKFVTPVVILDRSGKNAVVSVLQDQDLTFTE